MSNGPAYWEGESTGFLKACLRALPGNPSEVWGISIAPGIVHWTPGVWKPGALCCSAVSLARFFPQPRDLTGATAVLPHPPLAGHGPCAMKTLSWVPGRHPYGLTLLQVTIASHIVQNSFLKWASTLFPKNRFLLAAL